MQAEVTLTNFYFPGAASQHLSLLVSGNGQRVVLAALKGQVFLWESLETRDVNSFRANTIRGRWSEIASSENTQLPSSKDKEASLDCVFVQSQVREDKKNLCG